MIYMVTDNSVFADVGPRPPRDHVPRRGVVAGPTLLGRGPVHRRDVDGALESVRALLERLLAGVSEVGWEDLPRDTIRDCRQAPRDFRGIAFRVALLAERARARVPRLRRAEDSSEEEQEEESEAADTESDPGYDSH